MQPTVKHRVIPPKQTRPPVSHPIAPRPVVPRPPTNAGQPKHHPTPHQPRASTQRGRLALVIAAGALGFGVLMCGVFALGLGVVYGNGILPGVYVGDVRLGGKSPEQAAQAIAAEWHSLILTDGERRFSMGFAELGVTIDAQATARQAYQQGRGEGNALAAILGRQSVPPIFSIDHTQLEQGLQTLAQQVNIPAQDAGIQFVDGVPQPRPAQNGRILEVNSTLNHILNTHNLADGRVELIMNLAAPAFTDADSLVRAAAQVVNQPLNIRVFDPVTGDIVDWGFPPGAWASWLTGTANPASPNGLSLRLADAPLREYLRERATIFDASHYIDYDTAINAIQDQISTGTNTSATLRVRHRDRQHIVRTGETLTSIAWDYGIPYLYIQQANNGLTSLSTGQSITIPRADLFLDDYEPVPDKRIVVSISQQRVWVYENGALKWEWVTSTGISDSPTWTGLYQVISHVPNAYAGNWNLYMPYFIGVYRPIPGAEFTNGFHGFPTRGGGQILWENSLGRRVTYGCILLNNTNAQLLYNWAETGVIVEIQA